MNIVVLIYLVVCIILLIFDLLFLGVKGMNNQRFYPKMPKFEKMVEEEIANREKENGFSESFQTTLTEKLGKIKYLIALQSVLERNPQAGEYFKPYIFACMGAYEKRPDYEQAYYAYVVSTLDYKDVSVPKDFAAEFMKLLDSKSLYTFFNTINAVYKFADMNLLLTAVNKIDERAGFYHKKLFVDGMLQAGVDKKTFGEKLMERFWGYSDFTKSCILDYLRFAGVEASDFCMNLIHTEDQNTEIKYAALRYFIKHPSKVSKDYFMDILKNKEAVWIEEMLAIQGLSSYNEPEVHALIKEKITSPNWYVRVNTADYLKKNGLEKDEIAQIIALKDKYTNEILRYQYQNDEEMSAYITEMINKQEEEK